MSLSYAGSGKSTEGALGLGQRRRRKSEMVSFAEAQTMVFRAWALGEVRFGFMGSPLAL